jgi:hypothetical protein
MSNGVPDPGLNAGDPNGAAEQGRSTAPTNRTGINANTTDDHRVEVKNEVCHTEDLWWREIKGAKGEHKIGGFLEFIGGLKHSMILGFKTTFEAAFAKTWNIGPYSTEQIALKYEILAKKEETVFGLKSEKTVPWKWEKNNGPWIEQTAKAKDEIEKLQKEINDKMTERIGPALEATCEKYEARAKTVREKADSASLKIAKELRVKCEEARMVVNEFDRHVKNIDYNVGQFERRCKSMDQVVEALMEIKGSKVADKGASVKLKASVLKFTGSMIKLGE